ncbi:restriction endonuclease subunit S [Enterobacteriaceae bacterium 155047]|uniref:restriction endonuclease subunit S n=1 Tax=Huaxiibacter chinensis TaxID=2899785 RepID=UPI0021646008|nr:restriction endonuclease subunit S [Huaxiibacter chinensis]MCG5043819.1 restriction endonuclease subunit S [Huaxiibacter chinensis]
MVPEGWTKTLLGNVMQFKNGLNFTKNDTGEAIKIVGVANFKDLNELHSTEHLDVVRIANKIRDEELLANGDLLFVRSNGNKELIGRCLYFPCISERLSFSGFTIRGRAKQELVIPEYIAAVARSSFMKQQISKNGGGTNISNLSQKILNDIVIPLPKIDEQKRIIQVLSVWDKAIATTEKLLSNSQKQKKSLMQQLLTGKRYVPEFSKGWKEVYLGDIAKITTGSSNRQDSQLSGKYTFFDRSEDIRSSDRYLFDGEAIIVPGEGQDFIPKYFFGKFDLHQRTYAIMDFPTCDGKYLFYAIHYFRAHFLSQAVGSTVKSLRLPMFQKMKLHLPTLAEQKKIALILSNADQEIELQQQKLNHLKQEKKALMQQLLTGKRRVKVETA